MHKTKLFDEHILAEVRPFVSSMPEEQYVAQTNGSARMRVAKFEDGRYQVRGVPGHTHNSTAICSVEADFSKTRTSLFEVTEAMSCLFECFFYLKEQTNIKFNWTRDGRSDMCVVQVPHRI